MKKVSTMRRGMARRGMAAVVGLDLSDKKGNYAVLSWRGDILEEGMVAMTGASLRKRFGDRCYRVVIEAGTHSPWVSRELQALGHEVIVANPRQLPLIYRNNRKNDRLDALNLARLARLDPGLLAPISHRGEEAQAHLALLRSRDQLVAMRTGLISHVRGSVKSIGERLPSARRRPSPPRQQALSPSCCGQPFSRFSRRLPVLRVKSGATTRR